MSLQVNSAPPQVNIKSDHLETRYEDVLRGAGKTICVSSGVGDQVGAVHLVVKRRRLNGTNYVIVATLTVLAHFADLSMDESMSALKADEAQERNPQQSASSRHDDATRRQGQ